MNLPRFFRPKYEHPDPTVRMAAVSALTDQELLGRLVTTDEDPAVRAAALQRITDQEVRAEIANGTSAHNVAALDGITDVRLLVSVARHAASVQVRGLAVARIEDPLILAGIAAQDPDPSIRRQARLKHRAADRVHEYLKAALAKLEVTNAPASPPDGFGGSLDEVCGALMRDSRFQIDAVLSEPEPAGAAAIVVPSPAPTAAAPHEVGCVELIAHHRTNAAANDGHVVHFQIKIWRRGENAFEWRMAECRAELTNNVEFWAASSNG